MRFKKYHRRYPERKWDYKAISTRIDNKEIIYYTNNKTSGVEIYSGSNYDIKSKNRSYSRHYRINNIPIKYKNVVSMLMKVHRRTNWSKAKYVNYN